MSAKTLGRSAPKSLAEFVTLLRREGEIVDVAVTVDPRLEVAEIHRRVIAAGGPALFFHDVKGCDFPLVTNLFGSHRRMELAFGHEPEELVRRAARLPTELLPPTVGKLWGERSLLSRLSKVGLARHVRGRVLEERTSPPRLSRLPALQTWPRDGGRFITLPLVYTEHPATGGSNLGIYRIQLQGDDAVSVHMQIGKGGGFHLAAAEARSHALPVNIFVGGPPALILAAVAPLPENVPELLLASLALGEKLDLCKNPVGDLPLISDADFAITGEIAAGARHPEGPFGDHYGYYSEVHDYPLMRCSALFHKKDAIFPATVVGKPRQEDFFLGDYLQSLLSPLFPIVMPSVQSLWSYGETGYHSLSAAVVRERYKREAMVSAFRILGEGQLALTKFLLVTDRAVELRDFKATLTHVLERADFATDLFIFSNLSMDSLDYAGPRINEGSKGVLLGLGEPRRKLPTEFVGTLPSGVRRANVFSPGCLVLEAAAFASDPELGARVARTDAFATWPLLVLSDDADRHTRTAINFLWATFTRFNPASDIRARRSEVVHNHVTFEPPIVIDARMKPSYPEELFCDDETSRLVDRRWKEYFGAVEVAMGDSSRGHLA